MNFDETHLHVLRCFDAVPPKITAASGRIKPCCPCRLSTFPGHKKQTARSRARACSAKKRSFVPGSTDAAVSLPAEKRGRNTAFRSGLKEAATCALLVRPKTPTQKLTRFLKFKRLKDRRAKLCLPLAEKCRQHPPKHWQLRG